MRTVSRTTFTTVKTEGAILPADLLQRITEGKGLDGLRPEDYHLLPNERLNEAINRSWNRCQSAWASFDQQRGRLPATDTGTTLTRQRWLLILFQELGYGRLQFAGGLPLDGATYPISHSWGHVPIHLITFRQDLDRRGEVRGAVKRSPHSLLQEFLNRSDDHLWGFASNGLRLRVLRDNVSLTRAAYVEFDLEAMMAGELYADFALLWLVCHQSRVEGDLPSEYWLERWSKAAADQGVRALDALRSGVREAIVALGRGFLAHRANAALKARLQSGELGAQDYYRQLLRLVYRLIFLFVAEDRELLLLPDTPDGIQRHYADFYSVRRLRDMAETLRGGPHADLYRGLRLIFTLLRDGYPALGLPALGSFLFSERATPDLDEADLANGALLEAVRALAFTIEGKVRRPVDYRNLGAEELGSVYESLLELHPQLNADAAAFELDVAAGSERKTTGSYYTPASLIHCLLDSALEPVVEDRLKAVKREGVKREEEAILSIKVVDPACGSGHFLIAAAHRLARHLARVRTGDDEPAPAELRAALRDVVRHCIHGVDINPMAVELCKVALWMETLDPGKPLSFLDRNIQCGNSLIGATPALLDRGIPNEAFKPITGDDKAYCREFKKKNRQQRSGQLSFLTPDLQPWERLGNLAASMMSLDAIEDDTLDNVRRKQEMYESLVRSSDYRYGRLWADAWCAAFVWKKTKEFAYPITEEVFRNIERNPFNLPKWMGEEIERLREQYQFFHWHLAFPHVFSMPAAGEEAENEQTGWNGGFDVVLGNPPWERVKLQQKEFFATRSPDIAEARTAAERRKLIAALPKNDPDLHRAYLRGLRKSEAVSSFLRTGGRYPLSAVGDVNTYQVFAGLARQIVDRRGRAGIVVPTGIATDYFNRDYFGALVNGKELASLYDFENREGLFPSVHRSYKFSLLTLSGPEAPVEQAEFAFFVHQPDQLRDPERRFALTRDDLRRINPNTSTCPVFRTRRDADLTRTIYARVPVLVDEAAGENPWGVSFLRMFDMANDSSLFRTREQLETEGFMLQGNRFVRGGEVRLPLYEAKMANIFDHRAAHVVLSDTATVRQGQPKRLNAQKHADPELLPLPRYWVKQAGVLGQLGDYGLSGLLGFTDVTSPTNERTMLATLLPIVGVGHTMPLIFPSTHSIGLLVFLANLNSFVFDYVGRQKVGGIHYTYFILRQIPILPLDRYAPERLDFIMPRVLELTYTAWDLQPFAQDCGYHGPPFRWDEERRFLLRCELDAAYFHLYGIPCDDVDYIMDTFPIVKRKDEATHGEYRTKRVILEIYDAMQQAIETGQPYQTRLDPPPADPRVAHPPRNESDVLA